MTQPVHGGDIYTAREHYTGRIVDFSANINPLGIPERVKLALCESITACNCYPDPFCRALTHALSKQEGIPPEWILCGNGAADVIYRLAYALRPKTALLAAPCFAEYEQALLAAGCEPRFHMLREEDGFALTRRVLNNISLDTQLVFLCTPNNPTGVPIAPALLEDILQRCTECGAVLALDECFVDFLEEPQKYSLLHRLKSHKNLVLFRAFTKLYAIPGVRLGQCYCSDEVLLGRMYACGSPWSVSVPAQAAGVQALAETAFVEQTRALVRAERAFLASGLAVLGCAVVPSHANFILFRVPKDGILEALRARGILLRSCDNYRGLRAGWLRTAVKGREDNALLLQALGEVLA